MPAMCLSPRVVDLLMTSWLVDRWLAAGMRILENSINWSWWVRGFVRESSWAMAPRLGSLETTTKNCSSSSLVCNSSLVSSQLCKLTGLTYRTIWEIHCRQDGWWLLQTRFVATGQVVVDALTVWTWACIGSWVSGMHGNSSWSFCGEEDYPLRIGVLSREISEGACESRDQGMLF